MTDMTQHIVNYISLYQGSIQMSNQFLSTLPATLPLNKDGYVTEAPVTKESSIILYPIVSVGIKVIPLPEKVNIDYETTTDVTNRQFSFVSYVIVPANALS